MPNDDKTKGYSSSFPWQDANRELDQAAYRIVLALDNVKREQRTGKKLPSKQESFLRRRFKDAKHSRGPAARFMRAMADAIGFEDPENAYVLADMKDWSRAAEKFLEASRNISDLGRGRIYLDTVDDYHSFQKVMKSKKKDGTISAINFDDVRIKEGSQADYLTEARKSGFAGFVNFDIVINLSKNRIGRFEVQFMPRAYEKIDKTSHRLFDLIRIYDEEVNTSFMTEADQEIRDSLVLANHAIFIEHGIRSGFISLRKDKLPKVTDEKMNKALDILERVQNELNNLPGRRYAWIKETSNALTEAQASLVRINKAQKQRNYKLAKSV